MATPGYRAKFSIVEAMAVDGGRSGIRSIPSFAAGALSETGNPFDLAIDGEGFFELRGPAGAVYTRNGQFRRAEDGRLLGVAGAPLQAVGGGDVVVPASGVTVSRDGVVLVDGVATTRLQIVALDEAATEVVSDGLLRAPSDAVRDVAAPVVRQGFLEGSNVTLGQEMIVLMESVRRAETGQRLMNVYDDLLGRAVTAFGTSGS